MPKASKYFCQDIVENGLLCNNGGVCGRGFVHKGDLERHRKIHTGNMQHHCSYCARGFQQKTQLSNHENIHTGNAPHRCDICGETFKDPSSCCRHRKEQHEGNYVCFVDDCRKTIARKSNFRNHLQGHKAYRADMDLELHWVRRDPPRPKRAGRTSGPSKKCVATKIESTPEISIGLQMHGERYQPIEAPQLYAIDSISSPYPKPYLANESVPHALAAAEQSCGPQLSYHLDDMMLWLELQECQNFIDAQNSQCYSDAPFTPPSLSSSVSSSPESSYLPFHQSYPDSIETYQQSPPHSLQTQDTSGTILPLSWFDSPKTNHEALSLPIDEFSLLQSNFILNPSLQAQPVR